MHIQTTRWFGSTRRRSPRRAIGALGAAALVAATLAATPTATSASIGTSDATLITTFPTSIAPVYNTSTERAAVSSAGKPTGTGTAAAAAAVSATCAAGNPLAAAQWYALPAADASRIAVAGFSPGRTDPEQAPVSLGFVTGDTTDVISCGGAPVNLPADRPVLVVAYFEHAVARCVNDDASYYDCDAAIPRATLHREGLVPPANDRWQDATPISGNSFFTTVDTSQATFDGLSPVRQGDCFLSNIDPVSLGNVWFRYTPTFSGHVNVVARSAQPGYWAWPVIAKLGAAGPIEPDPDSSDECVGTTNVVAGQTYLIAVGGWFDPYFGEQNPIGGEVSLAVSRTAPLPVVRDLNAAVDSAAHSATLSWFGRWDESVPVTGLRVSRISPDGRWSTVVSPSTRSYTFTHLNGWVPYLMTVETLGASGTVTPDSPRASRFVYLSQPQPSRPLAVTAAISGVRRITVRWHEPAFNGDHPVIRYRVRQFTRTGTSPERTWTRAASARSLTVTGLRFNRGYRYDVTAFNVDGYGRPSLKTGTLRLTGIATAPTSVRVTPHRPARTATLAWRPPANTRGGLITGYRVGRAGTDSLGARSWSRTVSAAARSLVFTRLVRGTTYTLSVRAVTAQGLGARAIVRFRL